MKFSSYLYLFLSSFLCLPTLAQTPDTVYVVSDVDSSDIYFNHLQLDEVVVTGMAGSTLRKHSTFAVESVSSDALHSSAATNVVDALSLLPGVSQVTTGGAISKPVIRGLGFNRIVVVNDGVRQEGQQWGDEHGLEVDGYGVSSAEVIKGPSSLIYGSDAMAGVLILHPQPVLADGDASFGADAEYQSNNGLCGLSLNSGGNAHGFVFSGRYSGRLSHAYQNSADGFVPGSQFSDHSGRVLLGLQHPWGHSFLSGSVFSQKVGIVEGERDSLSGSLLSSYTHPRSYSVPLPFQRVQHHKLVSDNQFRLPKAVLKAVFGYQLNRRREFEDNGSVPCLYFRQHTLTYDVSYVADEDRLLRYSFGFGGMWQRSQNLARETLIPAYALFDAGAFATGSLRLGRFIVASGLRLDSRHLNFANRSFCALSGSVGSVFNASDSWSFKLNLSRGFRAPNMSELGSDGVHEGTLRYEVGNPRLKSEFSFQADLGVDLSTPLFSASLAAFANRIDNYIFARRTGDARPDGLASYAYTQGDALLLGFELGSDCHPVHAVHFANSFSFVSARQLHQPAESSYLPFIPAPRWSSDLKYEISHRARTFNNAFVSFGCNYFLQQYHCLRTDGSESPTPAYALFNLSLGFDVNHRGSRLFRLRVVADNLFDKVYQSHLSRLKYAPVNPVSLRQGVCNMGRNFVVKISVPVNFRLYADKDDVSNY